MTENKRPWDLFQKARAPHADLFEAAMRDNPWATPPADDFYMLSTVEDAAAIMEFNNWAVGVAFWIAEYPLVGFANQSPGGEWAVMRKDIRFDSLSGWAFGDADKLRAYCERVIGATDEQLRQLDY